MEEEKEIFRCDSCKRVIAIFKPNGYFESTSGTRVSSNGIELYNLNVTEESLGNFNRMSVSAKDGSVTYTSKEKHRKLKVVSRKTPEGRTEITASMDFNPNYILHGNNVPNSNGKDLKKALDKIVLELKEKCSYSYLKQLSSEGKWERGKYKNLSYYELLEDESPKDKRKRETVKIEHMEITQKLKSQMKEIMESGENSKGESEYIRNMAQGMGVIYEIDKHLHNIRDDKEEKELEQLKEKVKQEKVKFEMMKKELEDMENGTGGTGIEIHITENGVELDE